MGTNHTHVYTYNIDILLPPTFQFQVPNLDFEVLSIGHIIFIILGTDLLTWILPDEDEFRISVLMLGSNRGTKHIYTYIYIHT